MEDNISGNNFFSKLNTFNLTFTLPAAAIILVGLSYLISLAFDAMGVRPAADAIVDINFFYLSYIFTFFIGFIISNSLVSSMGVDTNVSLVIGIIISICFYILLGGFLEWVIRKLFPNKVTSLRITVIFLLFIVIWALAAVTLSL